MQLGKQRPYELEEYKPEWKQWFVERSARIAPLFGDNLISIEHIGSTSIEGMFAKPNIDILAVVENLDAVDLKVFIDAGYTPQGRGYVTEDDEYITEDTSDGKRITSIHTLEKGNPKIREYREFREYLKNNEEDRNVYIALKRSLYVEHPNNYGAYDSGKTDTINQIKFRAHEWAKHKLPQVG